MQTLWQDIRYALRQLRKSPGFTATAILTLALGIGATTAIFTLVYQVLLRSIPISHPEQLYKMGQKDECCVYGWLQEHWGIASDDLYLYLRDHTPGTDGIAAVEAGSIMVSAHVAGNSVAGNSGAANSVSANNGAAQPLNVRFVSGNYFPVLGVMPFAGRLLTPDDDRAGAAPTAAISYTIWKTKFGGDPSLVGSTVMMTGHPVTIVGITAANFLGERNAADPSGVWIPLAFEPTFEPDRQLLKYPNDHWLDVLIRIRDPKKVAGVQAAILGELHQWLHAHLDHYKGLTEKDLAKQTTELVSASGGINTLRDDYESGLKLLLEVAGAVLLIACANLANLMLVRGMGRQQELSVRSALGAPRGRLVRQTLIESLLLALFGGIAALALAYAGTHFIIAMALPSAQVTPLSASPSLPVLGFALAVSLFTGALFGIGPAWITSRSNPVEALRGANRSTRDSSALPQKLLVILQAALSLVLLSTGGLLITSLRHLERQDFHFNPQGRLLLDIDLQAAGYKADKVAPLYRQFDDKLAHLPGVENFAYATYGPMDNNNWNNSVYFPGVAPDTTKDVSYTAVSPKFFDAVGTHILLGRAFTDQDTDTSRHVAVVNQTFVDQYLKGKRPIGEHFGPDRDMTAEFEIVGVAEDTKYNNPSMPAHPMYFTPITQTTAFKEDEAIKSEGYKHEANNIIVQYRGDESTIAASIRQTLKSIDPEIPIIRMRSYEAQLSTQFTQEEMVVRLTTLFGILALVLASIGLYGVTAYGVAKRTSEIGIRMALGASRGNVLKMILESALTQAVIGLCIGLPFCYMAAKLVAHSLYQTNSFQPFVLCAVALLLLLAATAAALIPARRAASIEPMQALRTD